METFLILSYFFLFTSMSTYLIYSFFRIKFLIFKIEKHPILIEMVDSTLNNICDTEGIKVFNKSEKELNKGIVNVADWAAGKYHYTLNQEFQESANNGLKKIEEIEYEYGMPYEKIVTLINYEGDVKKEEFILPRISLAQDFLMDLGLKYYYETFFHELGHHFAIKELGVEHTEKDANRYAEILINKHFPQYFKLFLFVYSRINLTPIEEIKLYLQYFYFYYLKSKIK